MCPNTLVFFLLKQSLRNSIIVLLKLAITNACSVDTSQDLNPERNMKMISLKYQIRKRRNRRNHLKIIQAKVTRFQTTQDNEQLIL